MTKVKVRAVGRSRQLQRLWVAGIAASGFIACGQSESALVSSTGDDEPAASEPERPAENEAPAGTENERSSALGEGTGASPGRSESAEGNLDEPETAAGGNGNPAAGGNNNEPAGDSQPEPTGNGEPTPAGNGEPSPLANTCAELGLQSAAFREGDSVELGGSAGDFTVNTTAGAWSLSDQWSGCDSYVFITDPGNAVLVRALGPELFARSAPNTHYFFLNAANAGQGAEIWETQVSESIGRLPQEQRGHWEGRVHFVTDTPLSIEGSLGSFARANPNAVPGFAIDRAQTWDSLGSVNDVGAAGFAADTNVFGYSSRYYNFRFDQAARLAAEDGVTEVPLMENIVFAPETNGPNGPFSNSNQGSIWPAEFPDAATMANFDSLELVMVGQCGPDQANDCGFWDYEAFIQLCADSNCDTVVGEIARWVTPYSRPGTRTWVYELSPLLGLFREGGTHYFQFRMLWNMNPNTWNMTFRLRDKSPAASPPETVPAWKSNHAFKSDYNGKFSPIEFTPPSDTKKVELFAVISGHGQDTGNCAEWCEHQHEISVNGGSPHLREFPNEVRALRCAELVDEGLVPGQFGNWTPGRAGWCPGMPVKPWILDITEEVTIGESNTLNYRGLLNGAPVPDDEARGRIRFQTYLVYSK